MKIRKAFQGTVPENKILDTYSTSQTDTYSCNYINNKSKVATLWSGSSGSTGDKTLNESLENYDFLLVGTQTGNYSKGSILIPTSDINYEAQGSASNTYEIPIFQSSSVYSTLQIYFKNATTLYIRSASSSGWGNPNLKYVIGIKL